MSLQSCPTLCDPIDGSPRGPPVPGILQARTLEWVAISFSNAWKWKGTGKSLSLVQLLATPWTAAHPAPLPMGFSRQECWSRVPLHHSSKASILQRSALFTVQLSHSYMTTGKTIAFSRWTFVGKLMSLIFNVLSKLVITFLPRSKCLLISRL